MCILLMQKLKDYSLIKKLQILLEHKYFNTPSDRFFFCVSFTQIQKKCRVDFEYSTQLNKILRVNMRIDLADFFFFFVFLIFRARFVRKKIFGKFVV